MKEYEGKREIGENFAVSQEEKEEDLLERLYLWRQEGRPLWPAELCVHMRITRRELNQLMRQMVRYGYLEEPEERRELEMTPLGRARGAECLARHQRLTQLIQMVCDLDEEQAEENACRMEHVVSRNVIVGIEQFLRSGDTHDRILKNTDLSTLYEPGNYEFCMGIYRPEKRYPRILAEEFFLFVPEIRLNVKEDGSFFSLKKRDSEHPEQVWYRKRDRWRQAEQEYGEFRIPTAALTYTVSPLPSVTEGDLILAFPSEGLGPAEENCRELNVHIW